MRSKFVLVAFLALGPVLCQAAPPELLSFQGRLEDPSGVPVTGVVTLTARLYAEDTTGAAAIWAETDPVSLTGDGVFVTTLGDVQALPTAAFDRPLWAGFTVDEAGGGQELSPRSPLRAAPYAMAARSAAGLSGLTIRKESLPSGEASVVVTSEDVVYILCRTADGCGNGTSTVTLPPAAGAAGRVVWVHRGGNVTSGNTVVHVQPGDYLSGLQDSWATFSGGFGCLGAVSNGSDEWALISFYSGS